MPLLETALFFGDFFLSNFLVEQYIDEDGREIFGEFLVIWSENYDSSHNDKWVKAQATFRVKGPTLSTKIGLIRVKLGQVTGRYGDLNSLKLT